MWWRIVFGWLVLFVTGCSSLPAIPAVDSVSDIRGERHRPLEVAEGHVHVLIFITKDCPIANFYAPEIQRLVRHYEDASVQFYLVHVDPDVGVEAAIAHAEAYGFEAPVIIDTEHRLVEASGATVTPEAAVLTSAGGERELRYRGRIDDLYRDFGKRRKQATRHELRDAVDALLTGGTVDPTRTDAIGCYIPSLP